MNEEFDYKGFANQLRFQVRGMIPEEYSDRGIYIRDLVYKYSILAGERVSLEDCKDNELRSIFVQVIAEWVFHKTVDLIASGVPEDLHETVLNNLYSDLYDFGLKNLKQTGKLEKFGPQRERHLIKIEKLVDKSFKKSLKDLLDKNLIDKDIYTAAIKHSNMEDYQQEQIKNAEIMKISVFGVLKGNIYFSIAFPLALVVFYLMTVATFLSGQIAFGFVILAFFCTLLWRFLTYENYIEDKGLWVPVSIWDVIKLHPFITVAHFLVFPKLFAYIIYYFDKGILCGEIISSMALLFLIASFLSIKSDIYYKRILEP